MIIHERVFDGYIIECACGRDIHVPAHRLRSEICPCGKVLGQQTGPVEIRCSTFDAIALAFDLIGRSRSAR